MTFDVTDRLRLGANAIGVILGNGRFFAPRRETPQTPPALTATYGYPKLLLQLEIEYEDGTKTKSISDESWRLTTEGPIRANNEYDGEEYDARMEMPGWDRAGFDDSRWEQAHVVAAPGGALKAQMIEPMQVTQIIHPVAITNPKPGTYIVDMGQNFYGTVRMKATGPSGTQVRMTSAYSLNPDGTLKTADNRSARSTDIYTFKGQGVEEWNPRFRGQGFRRVQVTGFPGTPSVDNFEGLVIQTAAEPAGEFQSSNDLVNRIHTRDAVGDADVPAFRASRPRPRRAAAVDGRPSQGCGERSLQLQCRALLRKMDGRRGEIATGRRFDSGCLHVLDVGRRRGVAQRIHDYPRLVH